MTNRRAVRNPGVTPDLVTCPEEQIRRVQTGATDPLVVRVFGQDLGVLRSKAEEVRQAIGGIDGVANPRVDAQPQEPSVEIEVDLAAAQKHGIKPGDVRRAAAVQLSGVTVGNIFEEQKVFDVTVWSTPATCHSLGNIADLLIDTPGGKVRLGDVASVKVVPSPTVIRHADVSRYVDVTAAVRGRPLDAVTRDVQQALRGIQFPLEHHAAVLGGYAAQRQHRQRVLFLAVAAAIVVLLLLQAAFASWRLAWLVFLSLPLALVGGALAAFAFGGGEVTSLGSFAGLFAVLAIAVRNGVLLVGHLQRLQREQGEESEESEEELVVRGTRERFAPTALSALAVGLPLVPLVLLGSIPGLEVVRPLAVVILGGLVTTMLVGLLLVPVLYLRLAPRTQPETFAAETIRLSPA
jgi:Cu/Ag efflux pump CusA